MRLESAATLVRRNLPWLGLGLVVGIVASLAGRALRRGPASSRATAVAADGVSSAPGEDRSVQATAAASTSRPPASQPPSSLPPIGLEPLFTNLAVDGYPEPVVSLPNGAADRRPVLIALHGTGDRPDYNCDAWRHVTNAWGFILCPRGRKDATSTKSDERFTLRLGHDLRRYVDASLAALEARFPGYVDVDRPLIAGFSLGATAAGALAVAEPARFPRVAMLDGGASIWSTDRTRRFLTLGGLRVLFGCGSSFCPPDAKPAAARLRRAGLDARVVFADVGHSYDRPLQEALIGEARWFFGDDPRWAGALR